MLTVQHLRKKFEKKEALSGVSFSVTQGVCGLLGPNGAGKTTLLRCITGIMKADSGDVIRPEKVGYLPQRFGAYKALTVEEILEYYAALKKVPVSELKLAVEEAAEAVNLTSQLKTRTGALSGGMLRRLGIAQAILGAPDLVLFDEPTTGLDPEERMRFKLLLSDLRRKGISSIISTHIVEDVEAVCDRILILRQGHIVKDGSLSEVSNEAKGKTYLVPASMRDDLRQPFLLIKSKMLHDEEYIQVVSEMKQPGTLQAPTLEDGYFCCIHDMP